MPYRRIYEINTRVWLAELVAARRFLKPPWRPYPSRTSTSGGAGTSTLSGSWGCGSPVCTVPGWCERIPPLSCLCSPPSTTSPSTIVSAPRMPCGIILSPSSLGAWRDYSVCAPDCTRLAWGSSWILCRIIRPAIIPGCTIIRSIMSRAPCLRPPALPGTIFLRKLRRACAISPMAKTPIFLPGATRHS